jgi:hypothetical protein
MNKRHCFEDSSFGQPLSPAYEPTYSPTHSPTHSPAYRPTSPVQDGPSSPQYRPASPCRLLHHGRSSDRSPSIYDLHPGYHEILSRIERNDPSLTHVFLLAMLDPLYGHPELSPPARPFRLEFSAAELSTLGDALSVNTCIASLDLRGLELGAHAVSLMGSIVRMTSLTSLDLRGDGISQTDSCRVFKSAADAGMTQLRELNLWYPQELNLWYPHATARDVAACAEWARLKLPQLPPAADFVEQSNCAALLRHVINGIVADHAFASIATSKFATFRSLSPLYLRPLPCPPRRLLSLSQQQRLLASGGCTLLLLPRMSSPRVSEGATLLSMNNCNT